MHPIKPFLGLVLLQYIAIYSLTPHDLDWHLDTALSRLVTHLYPAALFLVFTRLDWGEGDEPSEMRHTAHSFYQPP